MSGVLIREGAEGDLRHRDAEEKAMSRQRQRLEFCRYKSRNEEHAKDCQQPPESRREAWNGPPSESSKGTKVDANKFLWNE